MRCLLAACLGLSAVACSGTMAGSLLRADSVPTAPSRSFVALRAQLAQVTEGLLRRSAADPALATLSASELKAVVDSLRSCRVSEGWSVTTPPWDVLIELRSAEHVWPLQWVTSGFRIDPSRPYAPRPRPPAVDCVLGDDAERMEGLLRRYLGPSSVKEYQALPRLDGVSKPSK